MDNNIIDNELEALNNCLNHYNLTGYKIHKYYQQDKRIKTNLYFLTDTKGTSLTGHWDYSQLNHFIMGYGKAYKNYEPMLAETVKEISDNLLNTINTITNQYKKDHKL